MGKERAWVARWSESGIQKMKLFQVGPTTPLSSGDSQLGSSTGSVPSLVQNRDFPTSDHGRPWDTSNTQDPEKRGFPFADAYTRAVQTRLQVLGRNHQFVMQRNRWRNHK